MEARAARTRWLRFESDSGWFNNVSMDVELIALRLDHTPAVTTISDTD